MANRWALFFPESFDPSSPMQAKRLGSQGRIRTLCRCGMHASTLYDTLNDGATHSASGTLGSISVFFLGLARPVEFVTLL